MGVNSLPKTVTRQRRDCDLNPGPSAPESSTLTTWLKKLYTVYTDEAVLVRVFDPVDIVHVLLLHQCDCISPPARVRHSESREVNMS